MEVQKFSDRSIEDLNHWEDNVVVNHDRTHKVSSPGDAWAKTKTQCALVPEDVPGPYYYPGELVRSDISENLNGVPMWLDVQFVDTNTCHPIRGMTVDIWAVGIATSMLSS